jgi:hypothetical protein
VPPTEITAAAWLTFLWNRTFKGTGQTPKTIYLDNDLFELYKSELVSMTRWVEEAKALPEPCLVFKTCKIYKTGNPGYGVWFAQEVKDDSNTDLT